jgi:hypothetical protein
MGKNLHPSIRPYIENALNNHFAVSSIEQIENEDFYIYKVSRNNGKSSVIVALSDDYHLGWSSLEAKPTELKNGGFFLKARPEASGVDGNIVEEKIGYGSLGKLMGALNIEEFWTYEPPKKDK